MIEEVIYNVMKNYKTPLREHELGPLCWCNPICDSQRIVHQNYEWLNLEWRLLPAQFERTKPPSAKE